MHLFLLYPLSTGLILASAARNNLLSSSKCSDNNDLSASGNSHEMLASSKLDSNKILDLWILLQLDIMQMQDAIEEFSLRINTIQSLASTFF